MPIIDLQRRMRQLGEIRIGHAVSTGRVSSKTGKPIMRPEKLSTFRLTSASKPLLERVAELYGGTVRPWTPANGGPQEWEVYTEVDRLPVLVPPGEPVTQWYELYRGSKCVRRCDGRTEQKSDQPCLCDPERRECQITTRLNVMLRDVPGLGVWLLTTHGYYAATELPEVAQFLAATRGYVDAWLAMEEKQIVRDDGTVARFMVPKLDVNVTPAQLLSGEVTAAAGGGERRAVAGGGQAAIEGPRPDPDTGGQDSEDLVAAAHGAATLDELREVWRRAQRAGAPLDDHDDPVAAAIAARRAELEAAEAAELAVPDDGRRGELWQQIVAAWPGTMPQLQEAFLRYSGGVTPETASEQDLEQFLRRLSAGDVPGEEPA